jgi:hypothetical protein
MAKAPAPAAKQPGKPGKKKMSEADKKARQEFLKGESKAQKFVRLGTPRVNKAVKVILQIRTLGGAGYESTADQQKKIVDALQGAVNQVRDRFAGKKQEATTITL